jgi:hypothetical protein
MTNVPPTAIDAEPVNVTVAPAQTVNVAPTAMVFVAESSTAPHSDSPLPLPPIAVPPVPVTGVPPVPVILPLPEVAAPPPPQAPTRQEKATHVDGLFMEVSRTRFEQVTSFGSSIWGLTWTVGGWCELRDGSRNFRLDRMAQTRVLETRYQPTAGRTLQDLFEFYRENTLK